LGVSIGLIVEGQTERAIMPALRRHLEKQLAGRMPRIKAYPCRATIYRGQELRRRVGLYLDKHDYVIALTDVYTGSRDFVVAADAKRKLREWVGPEPRFFPHAAQYEVEAWLLPYWDRVQTLSRGNRAAPGGAPENVNHQRPPSTHLRDIYSQHGKRQYSKVIDAAKILDGVDLDLAIQACPELKALIETIEHCAQAAA
jgi:hypothetical protein